MLGAPRGEYVPPREAAPKRKRAKIDRFVAAPAVNAAARLRAAPAAGATFHLVPAKPDWNCFVQRMGGHARNRLEWEGEADAPLPLAADEDFESDEESEQHLRAALEASRKEYEAAQADEADGADGDSATAEPSAAEPAKPAEAAAELAAAEGAASAAAPTAGDAAAPSATAPAPPLPKPPPKARGRFWLLPCTDDMAMVVAREQQRLAAAGWSLLTSGEAIIARLSNKAALRLHAVAIGLPQMLPDHYATPASATYPCVLKVAAGEHGEGVDIVQNAEEVRKLSRRYDGGWLLQELVVGAEEWACSLLVDRGVIKDAIATKYVYDKEEYIWPHVRELRDYRKSSRDVPAAHLTTFGAFLHAYSGVCNFNYKVRPDGRLCIFEINTRIGADLACDVPPPLLRSFFQKMDETIAPQAEANLPVADSTDDDSDDALPLSERRLDEPAAPAAPPPPVRKKAKGSKPVSRQASTAAAPPDAPPAAAPPAAPPAAAGGGGGLVGRRGAAAEAEAEALAEAVAEALPRRLTEAEAVAEATASAGGRR